MITWAAISSALSAFVSFFKRHPAGLTIMALMVYILYLRECTPEPKPCDPCPTFDTTAFMESIQVDYQDTTYKPNIDSTAIVQDSVPDPVEIIKEVPVWKWHEVDSSMVFLNYLMLNYEVDSSKLNEILAMLEDYNTKKYSNDTILHDTNGLIVIHDILFQNDYFSRRVEKRLTPQFTVVTKTIFVPEEKHNQVYLGIGAGRSLHQFGLTGNVMLITKKGHPYQVSYDFINKDVYITAYFLLKFKRRGR